MLIDKIRELERKRLAALKALNTEIKASGTPVRGKRTDVGVCLKLALTTIEEEMHAECIEMAQALIAVEDVLKQFDEKPNGIQARQAIFKIRKAIESPEDTK